MSGDEAPVGRKPQIALQMDGADDVGEQDRRETGSRGHEPILRRSRSSPDLGLDRRAGHAQDPWDFPSGFFSFSASLIGGSLRPRRPTRGDYPDHALAFAI